MESGEPLVDENGQYFTPRHLLALLKDLDDALLDMPLLLVHGKGLEKPNLVHGFVPAPVSVDRATVEAKKPSLLMLGHLTDLGAAKPLPRK